MEDTLTFNGIYDGLNRLKVGNTQTRHHDIIITRILISHDKVALIAGYCFYGNKCLSIHN